jgi:hypothetical protein
MQACDRCHARKTRCDRRIPQCSACERAGAACLHADRLRQRNLPRDYLDNMERIVQKLSEENKRLRANLNEARSNTEGGASTTEPRKLSESGQVPPSFQEPASHHPPAAPSDIVPPTSSQLDANGPSGTAFGTGDISVPSPRVASIGNSSTPRSSSIDSPTDAYALEVGYLTLIAASGESRYLGSSSGIGLASIISTIVDVQHGKNIMSLGMQEPERLSITPTPQSGHQTEFPLPSRNVANTFIDAYFQHAHITFPLLHRPSFMLTVERIYGVPGYYEAHAFDAFCFDMVLAIGNSNFNRFDDPSTSSSTYYSMAQSKVQAVVGMGGLTSLKAILLISQHGIFSNLRDTSANIWHLIGLGVRICFELGLHIESGQHKKERIDSSQQAYSISLEEEMARRTFWCLYNLDR